ncbi:uncharacterized protein LOC110980343, partial [Acanthaster planci]|uniref:Acyl carrier protein n=1 Tax=Acanthaster planci TaxID=133434 RepID=A0A8B7YMD8_ACAPL
KCAVERRNTDGIQNTFSSTLQTIQERVVKITVEQLGVDEAKVTAEAGFVEDLGADSLDTVELVMAFEEEFEVEIPDEKAEELKTVGQVLDYLKENMK